MVQVVGVVGGIDVETVGQQAAEGACAEKDRAIVVGEKDLGVGVVGDGNEVRDMTTIGGREIGLREKHALVGAGGCHQMVVREGA